MTLTGTPSVLQAPSVTDPAFQLHAGQWDMLRSRARVTVVTAGQGGGKTTGGYYWLLSSMQAFPGETWMVALPDYPTLSHIMLYQPDPDRETLPGFLKRVGEKPHLHVVDKTLECRSGTVFLRSADALTSWEGGHLKGAWLDEFDLMPLEAFRRAMERTRMRNGWVRLTGTPRLSAWVRTELQPKWEAGDPSVARLQFPSTANPRYPLEAMEEARKTLPGWLFRRLHFGDLAREEGGNTFRREWWRYYTELPKMQTVIQVVDTAYKTGTENDWSVVATWGKGEVGFYLLDIWRARVEYPELKRAVTALAEKWRPSRIVIEDAASGQSLLQDLKRSTLHPVIPLKVDRDKLTRAVAITGLVESGRCYLQESAPWLHDFVEELAAFPGPGHDDMVDTTVMALVSLNGGRANIRWLG